MHHAQDYKGLYRTTQDYTGLYRGVRGLNSLLHRLIKTGDRHTDRQTDRQTEFVESWGAYAPKNIQQHFVWVKIYRDIYKIVQTRELSKSPETETYGDFRIFRMSTESKQDLKFFRMSRLRPIKIKF